MRNFIIKLGYHVGLESQFKKLGLMTKPVIMHIHGVTKMFGPVAVVNNLSLQQHQGEILVFLGPSGCGKTTLLRLIAGFEKPNSGSIEINGKTMADSKVFIPPEKRDVGMVFQDYALFPHLNVAQNIAFGVQQNQRYTEKTVGEAISLVRLEGLEKRYPHQLSGGQQQRVALARALAPSPALVLLDEPLSNLDAQIRVNLRQQLRDIIKQSGTTAIFVTHDQEEALAIADRLVVLSQGQIEQLGTPEEIYQQPASKFVAEFVTQANFIPAQRLGQYWETELGAFAVNNYTENRNEGELMIPQEFLQLQPDDQARVIIDESTFLGREILYSLSTASGKRLKARLSATTRFSVGTKVKVNIENNSLLKVF